MICEPCKEQRHQECPSNVAQDASMPSMALSVESARIQLSGLCPCQHRAPKSEFVKSDIGTEFVQQIDDEDFHVTIHQTSADLVATGITPPPCPRCSE